MQRRTVLSALALAPWGLRAIAQEHHASHGDSNRVGLAMSATFAPDGSLWIIALNEQRQLFIQQSIDTGRTWSTPRVLNTGRDVIAADGENRPKLRFGPNGWAVISYTQPLAKPYTGEIRMLRSSDGGKSFSLPFTVHADRQIITHRFESIAFDASGALHTLWIDKRDLEALKARDKTAKYVGAAVYRNVSFDGGKTFGPDIKVADHSCECCRIALIDDGQGGLAAMWRHVFADDIRDHALTRIAQGGRDTTAVMRTTFDEWHIDACPHHGPSLALAEGGGFHAVWFGMRGGEPGVRYARLDANGNQSGSVRIIPDQGAEHADVCSVEKNVVIVWRSFDGQRMSFKAWLSGDSGRTFKQRILGTTEAEVDNPFLIRRAHSVFAVWRSREGVQVVPVMS